MNAFTSPLADVFTVFVIAVLLLVLLEILKDGFIALYTTATTIKNYLLTKGESK